MEAQFKGVKSGYIFNIDGTISIAGSSAPNSTIAVNKGGTFSWTGPHTFGSSVTLNSTTSNYSNFYNYAQIYNYGTFYQYGTFRTNATAGSIPYVNSSQNLVYDADDFYRDNTTKRYGFGIGTGDTLLAKIHVVGLLSCTGTPPACSTYTASGQGTCESYGCTWNYNGSCSSYGDEGSCNGASYCIWGGGSNCDAYNNDEYNCTNTSGCSWSPTYSDCSVYHGDQMTCQGTSGCSWSDNSCSSYNGDESGCNSAGCYYDSGSSNCLGFCSGSYQSGGDCSGTYGQSCQENPSCDGSPYPCSNYASSQGACEAVSGCSWSAEPALYADGDFKIGFSPTQLGGFWGANPVARSSGWSVTAGYTTDKAFNPESTTTLEVARVLGTLIDQLKTYGILGG